MILSARGSVVLRESALLNMSVHSRAEHELRTAALYGDVGRLEHALDAGASPHSRDRFGNSALEFAASRGRVAVIRRLLKAGARPDSAGANGATALHTAAKWGRSHGVSELLRRGADPTLADRYGRTALEITRQAARERRKGGAAPYRGEVPEVEGHDMTIQGEPACLQACGSGRFDEY